MVGEQVGKALFVNHLGCKGLNDTEIGVIHGAIYLHASCVNHRANQRWVLSDIPRPLLRRGDWLSIESCVRNNGESGYSEQRYFQPVAQPFGK